MKKVCWEVNVLLYSTENLLFNVMPAAIGAHARHTLHEMLSVHFLNAPSGLTLSHLLASVGCHFYESFLSSFYIFVYQRG